MKSFFTIHPGEFLVGDHVIRRAGRKYDVWVPAKDTGVDLLLTPRGRSRRAFKLQVKFSRSYGSRVRDSDQFLARGWYTLKTIKILKSPADIWVFVILDLRHQAQFVVVPLRHLKKRIPPKCKSWHLYLTVLGGKRCFNTRGMNAAEERTVCDGSAIDPNRDYTAYLNNWTFRM